MNKVILIGRLTKDPEVRYAQASDGQMAIARYTLAVDGIKKGEADFIGCVAFNKNGEFAEKYLHKGSKIAVEGRIKTGSYTNKDGQKVYTTDVVVEHHEFCESKTADVDSKINAPIETEEFTSIQEDDLPFAPFAMPTR